VGASKRTQGNDKRGLLIGIEKLSTGYAKE